jgi:hypothetical protein
LYEAFLLRRKCSRGVSYYKQWINFVIIQISILNQRFITRDAMFNNEIRSQNMLANTKVRYILI